MFRLAHLSDVHLGPMPPVTLRHLASKRITGYVNWRIGRRHQHTGEVTEAILAAIAEARPAQERVAEEQP